MSNQTSESSQPSVGPSFGMLSSGKRNPASFAIAAGINITIVVLVIILGLTAKHALVAHKYNVVELAVPTTPPPVKIKIPPPPQFQPPKVAVIEPPKINLSHPIPAPEIKPIQMEAPKPQVLVAQPKQNVVLAPQPKAALALSSAPTPQSVHQSITAVHLGDPLGARPNPNAVHGAVMVAALGNPNGDSGRGSPRGVVASASFGGLSAGHGSGTGSGHVVAAGLPTMQHSVSAAAVSTEQPRTTGLEIITKPPARYTEEARAKKVEGDVILSVTFTASGQVVVHGVVKGLGYGLDEEARKVAKEIRFRPATRNGVPTDLNTNITITFQLA